MTQPAGEMKRVTIHTDGGCEGNPGPGGWAAVLRYGAHVREISGSAAATTNNRMELQAAIEALRTLKEPCEVEFFTDSVYVRSGISEWLPRWKARGWLTVGKKPVKNEDLWRALEEASAPHRVTWKWLKGHAGHPENERCDELAQIAMTQLRKDTPPGLLKAALDELKARESPKTPQLQW
jgi:ribonuclease HI